MWLDDVVDDDWGSVVKPLRIELIVAQDEGFRQADRRETEMTWSRPF